ncbi:MAG: NADH-quinone oxidoreductase subunit NuoI [Acidobacteriota bacterium]
MITEMLKGLGVTLKQFFKKPTTVEYPIEKLAYSDRYRALHGLRRYEDGLERCVCCGLCAIACPADAIYMEAAENTDAARYSHGERYAKVYKIHMYRCIFCGFCEEACPEDAIYLTKDTQGVVTDRIEMVWDKEKILRHGEMFPKKPEVPVDPPERPESVH